MENSCAHQYLCCHCSCHTHVHRHGLLRSFGLERYATSALGERLYYMFALPKSGKKPKRTVRLPLLCLSLSSLPLMLIIANNWPATLPAQVCRLGERHLHHLQRHTIGEMALYVHQRASLARPCMDSLNSFSRLPTLVAVVFSLFDTDYDRKLNKKELRTFVRIFCMMSIEEVHSPPILCAAGRVMLML